MTIFQNDLDQLQKMPKLIFDARKRAERLRDQIGLHSVSLDGIPHGSGPHDKIGDLMPEILDAETEFENLEGAYWRLRGQVADWIDAQEDLKASFILSLRYLEGMDWERIADECNGTGDDPITGDAVRKYAMRYIKNHLREDESSGQAGR